MINQSGKLKVIPDTSIDSLTIHNKLLMYIIIYTYQISKLMMTVEGVVEITSLTWFGTKAMRIL